MLVIQSKIINIVQVVFDYDYIILIFNFGYSDISNDLTCNK